MLINMKYKGKLQKLWGITVGFVFIVILTTRLFISKESTSASQGEAFLSDLSNNIIPSTDWGKFLLGFTIGISMESNNEVLNTKAIMISRILDEGGNFSIFNYIGLIKGLLIETFGRQLGGPFAEIMSLEVLNAFEEEEGNILMTTLPYSMAKFGFCLIWKTVSSLYIYIYIYIHTHIRIFEIFINSIQYLFIFELYVNKYIYIYIVCKRTSKNGADSRTGSGRDNYLQGLHKSTEDDQLWKKNRGTHIFNY